jgi:hypothetical protein
LAIAVDRLAAFVLIATLADITRLPKYGPVNVNKLPRRCRIVLAKTIGSLSPRQRKRACRLSPSVWMQPQAALTAAGRSKSRM